MRRWAFIATIGSALGACDSRDTALAPSACLSPMKGTSKTGFHGGRAGTGWSDAEAELDAAHVRAGMRPAWTSAPFATIEREGTTFAGRAYASPLYADSVRITRGTATGESLSVVFVATSNGDVYAIS